MHIKKKKKKKKIGKSSTLLPRHPFKEAIFRVLGTNWYPSSRKVSPSFTLARPRSFKGGFWRLWRKILFVFFVFSFLAPSGKQKRRKRKGKKKGTLHFDVWSLRLPPIGICIVFIWWLMLLAEFLPWRTANTFSSSNPCACCPRHSVR